MTAKKGTDVTQASLELTREEIIQLMEKIAQERRSLPALQIIRDYRSGRLANPGELVDFLALADLLRKDDPLHAG